MIPKEAIKKAIEGGWKYKSGSGWTVIALDPSFWQCLGKALGWADNKLPVLAHEPLGYTRQKYAHRFYDLILTGGDTDAFWKELL